MKKKSKSKSFKDKAKWKKKENMLLSDNKENESVRLVENFIILPVMKKFYLFSLYFTPDMLSVMTTETRRYARLKNSHNFHETMTHINFSA